MPDRTTSKERTGQPTVDFGARLAAIASMLCLLAGLATAAFALVNGEAWRLAVALACVVVAIVGAWYALARRGVVRVAGATIALAGLGGLIAVIVTARFRGLLFAFALVLVGLSAAASEFALRAPVVVDVSEGAGRRRARPRRPVLIMNPKSGGGKVQRFRLPEECRARGIEPVILEPGDDLSRLAVAALDGGADVIGMAGGDGSQALVATMAAERDVPYVCIPAGTRNHLALDLGIDRDDVVGALSAFADGQDTPVDLATVNGRVFVNNVSMGLYAKIVQSDAYRDAKAKTAADMLPDLLGPEAAPFDLRFTGPDGEEWPYAHMLLVSNNPYRLDHLMGGGTRARMDTGRLGLAAARIDGAGAAVAFVGLEAAGRVRSFPGWLEWSAPTFEVRSAGPIEVGIDGEAITMEPPLVFRSRPGAMQVRLPPSSRLLHLPGEPADHTSTLTSLLHVAAGRV